MSQIFLYFGNIRLRHPSLTKAIDTYVRKVLINDANWPQDYNKWDPAGQDWGWLSSTDTSIVPPKIQDVLNKHGFVRSKSQFGEIRYELAQQNHTIPKTFDSITPPETDECIICQDDYSQGGGAVILPCNHLFHENCILLWLYLKGQCAICRQSPVDIIKTLNSIKENGNKVFKGGNIQGALALYSECLSFLDKLKDIPTLRFALNTNMALMYLRLEQWENAKQHAKVALEIPDIPDEQMCRASYRLGLANIGLKMWDSARLALDMAQRYIPGNTDIEHALRDIEEKRKV
jgi:tetratricopeptide (TPR) repeat protein